MTPKKPELLDLLRKQEGRDEAPGSTGRPAAPRAPSKTRRPLPPWIPLVLVVAVLGGLAWLASGFLGGDDEKFTVRVGEWHGEALLEEATRHARPLLAQAQNYPGGAILVELRKTPQPDGTISYHIEVGEADSVAELTEILEWVKGVTLPDSPAGTRPFADAKIAPR